jgi:hypothetical protein
MDPAPLDERISIRRTHPIIASANIKAKHDLQQALDHDSGLEL